MPGKSKTMCSHSMFFSVEIPKCSCNNELAAHGRTMRHKRFWNIDFYIQLRLEKMSITIKIDMSTIIFEQNFFALFSLYYIVFGVNVWINVTVCSHLKPRLDSWIYKSVVIDRYVLHHFHWSRPTHFLPFYSEGDEFCWCQPFQTGFTSHQLQVCCVKKCQPGWGQSVIL